MKCLKDLSNEHLKEISSAFAKSFLNQSGSLSSCMKEDEAALYFEMTLYEYMRIGALYTLSDNEEGYIVYHRKNKGLPWYRDLYLTFRYFKNIKVETMQKMIMIRRGWTDYTLAHTNTKDYIDVALVAVRKEYQGQGYLRKLLQEPFETAQKEMIPVILDTDAEHKALRYEHIGMEIEYDEILPSGLHLYRMIYKPTEAKQNES